MHRAMLLLIIFSIGATARAQKCELTLEQSPTLRGFTLGMASSQANSRLRGMIFPKPDALGGQKVALTSAALRRITPDSSAGVKRGELEFLDGRLVRIEVVYDGSVEWDGIDDFIFRLSQSLGLPPIWPGTSEPSYYARRAFSVKALACDGFLVRAILVKSSGGQEASLEILDASLQQTLEDRRRFLREKKRETFKP